MSDSQEFLIGSYLPIVHVAPNDSGIGQFGIAWEEPPFYCTYVGKLGFCPRFHQLLRKRIDSVFRSGVYDLDSIRLVIWPTGPFIEVMPGVNSCHLIPRSRGMGEHNIDNWHQALALQQVFLIWLDLAYMAMSAWATNPEVALDPSIPQPVEMLFNRPLEGRPLQAFPLNDPDFTPAGIVVARSHEEAMRIARTHDQDFRLGVREDLKPGIVLSVS